MQNDQKNPSLKFKDGVEYSFVCLNIWARCYLPFIRTAMGNMSMHFAGMIAFGAMFILAAYLQDPAMWAYVGLWFVFQGMQRVRTWWLKLRGCRIHSRFWGEPVFAMAFVKNRKMALAFEPFLVALIGAFITPVYPNVGVFLVSGFVPLAMCNLIEQQLLAAQMREMQDAQLEQESMARRYQNGGGD